MIRCWRVRTARNVTDAPQQFRRRRPPFLATAPVVDSGECHTTGDINGGEHDWTSRCNHFREGVDASRNREIRPYTHSLSLVDALVDAFSRFITLLLHYISEGISGSTSDKKMCTNHGHLEWMKTMVNDVDASNGKPHNPIILADKGFCNVEPEYNAVGVFLARTPAKSTTSHSLTATLFKQG